MTNAIGRTALLPLSSLAEVARFLGLQAGFLLSRSLIREDYPVTNWIVNHLPPLDRFEIPSHLVLSAGACSPETMDPTDCLNRGLYGEAMDGTSLIGIEAHPGLLVSKKPLNIVLGGYRGKRDPAFDCWLHQWDSAGIDQCRFLETVCEATGHGELLAIKQTYEWWEYVFKDRGSGKSIGLFGDISTNRELSGRVSPSITFTGESKKLVLKIAFRVLDQISKPQLTVVNLRISADSIPDWTTRSPWFGMLCKPPWNITWVGLGGMGWDADRILAEAHDAEAIPLGHFDFLRNRVSPELKGHRILLDAFKEKDGWQIAFHLFEREMMQKGREKIRHSLNTLFGRELITETAHDRWPGVFK